MDQNSQATKPLRCTIAHRDNRFAAPDRREIAIVAVAKAGGPEPEDLVGDEAALLLGDRRHAGKRLPIRSARVGGVADREDLLMARHAQIIANEDAAVGVGLGAEPFGGRRGPHSRRPNHRVREDQLLRAMNIAIADI